MKRLEVVMPFIEIKNKKKYGSNSNVSKFYTVTREIRIS